jgi:hypothetical protein
VPNVQGSNLDAALQAAGGTSSFTLLPGAGHMDDKFTTELTAPAIAFLDSVLR